MAVESHPFNSGLAWQILVKEADEEPDPMIKSLKKSWLKAAAMEAVVLSQQLDKPELTVVDEDVADGRPD